MSRHAMDELVWKAKRRQQLLPVEDRRRIRKAAHVTVAEMASVVGCKPSTLASWERGERNPRGEICEKYAAVLLALEVIVDEAEESKGEAE